MHSYVVNTNIDIAVFSDFYNWLKSHIIGNTANDSRSMLRLKHENQPIFTRADIYITDIEENQKFLSVHYTSVSKELINIYLAQHAMIMRSELPDKFNGRLGFSRYIRNIDSTKTTILPPENQMHRDFLNNDAAKLRLLEVITLSPL